MISLTKKSLLFVLLVYIACVICPCNIFRCGFRRSKEKVEEESPELRFCKMELYVEFKNDTGLDNFLHAFLNLNDESFNENQLLTEMINSYYLDLICSVLDMDLPGIWNSQEFCQEKYNREEEKCKNSIAEAGCEANVYLAVCIEQLYRKWKKKPENFGAHRGTENISNEVLNNAISIGSRLSHDFSDRKLLEDFYKSHGVSFNPKEYMLRSIIDEDFNDYYSDGSRRSHFMEHPILSEGTISRDQLVNSLKEARYSCYGVRNISYKTLHREYRRRNMLPKPFGDFYAMYLHEEMKKFGNTSSENEDDETNLSIRCCDMELSLEFKMNTGLGNFMLAFLNLNEDSFKEDSSDVASSYANSLKSNLIYAYYCDLLNTIQNMVLPEMMTPVQFCHEKYGREKISCRIAIELGGCPGDAHAIVCINHLYRNWKKRDELYPGAIPGTKHLSDEELWKAFSKGSGDIEGYPDEYLLKEYYSDHNVASDYMQSWANVYNRYLNEGSSSNNQESSSSRPYLNYVQQHFGAESTEEEIQRQSDLFNARYRRYGIGNISYADICREYWRRQNILKPFIDIYAMYLYGRMEYFDDRKFDTRIEYCRKHILG